MHTATRWQIVGLMTLGLAIAAMSTAYPAYGGALHQSLPADRMGPVHMTMRMTWFGYYDGHKDAYFNTDVSNKGQASAMKINYAPGLAHVPVKSTPAIYLVKGRAMGIQLAVFGSQPGESDYSPLWHEVDVQWKSGTRPVLLTSDNQILALARKGKVTMTSTHVLLNCPIISAGK